MRARNFLCTGAKRRVGKLGFTITISPSATARGEAAHGDGERDGDRGEIEGEAADGGDVLGKDGDQAVRLETLDLGNWCTEDLGG